MIIVSDVVISLDNRVRLVGAVLAASHWPQLEQARERHAVHPQAKFTAQYVRDFVEHPAVLAANEALAAGVPLAELFGAALSCDWPTFTSQQAMPASFAAAAWVEALADFYVDSAIAAFFWADHAASWGAAERELTAIFRNAGLASFLAGLTGQAIPAIMITPNLTYPALETVIAGIPTALHLILPPPKAYGESPPWPYREGVDWVLAQSSYPLIQHLLNDTLQRLNTSQQQTLSHAAVTLFLEKALGEADGMSYLVRSKKQYKLPDLPHLVETLRQHLANPHSQPLLNHRSGYQLKGIPAA